DEDRQPLRAERVRDDRRRGVEAAADLIRRRRLGIAERRVARRAAADLGDEAVPVLLRAAQVALGGGVPARGGRLLERGDPGVQLRLPAAHVLRELAREVETGLRDRLRQRARPPLLGEPERGGVVAGLRLAFVQAELDLDGCGIEVLPRGEKARAPDAG